MSASAPGGLELVLSQALSWARGGDLGRAERELEAALRTWPVAVDAMLLLADIAQAREDFGRAAQWLVRAYEAQPTDLELGFRAAAARLDAGDLDAGREIVLRLLSREPRFAAGWLLLGDCFSAAGDERNALRARVQAVTRAQAAGLWTDRSTTPSELQSAVVAAIRAVREGRAQWVAQAWSGLRAQHPPAELARVDRAVLGYLGEETLVPPHPRQRPKFFYMPGLPEGPYHDPFLQPWAHDLADAFEAIRDDALAMLERGQGLQDFMGFKPGEDASTYVGAERAGAAWDAFFFYRHGRRFDDNHRACPATSAVLESLDLCRIRRQTPEICFSVMRGGTEIKAHHGVTNTRLVMHLPLIVPEGCWLAVAGGGKHHWQPGRLMMFDDTYLHEAWNHSDRDRVILLMDCWNPLLTPLERQAVLQIVEAIDDLERFDLGELAPAGSRCD